MQSGQRRKAARPCEAFLAYTLRDLDMNCTSLGDRPFPWSWNLDPGWKLAELVGYFEAAK